MLWVLLRMWAVFPVLRRRRARVAGALIVGTVTLAGVLAPAGVAAASVAGDQAQAKQLEGQIAAQGEHVKALVSRFNEMQSRVNELDAQIASQQRIVVSDQNIEAAATASLRKVAIRAYTTGSAMDSSTLQMFGGASDIQTMLEESKYLGAVGSRLNDALTSLRIDQNRTQDAQKGLRKQQAAAQSTLHELATARDAANGAIASDEAKLTNVRGDLRTLIAAATQQHEAALRAERALAAAASARRAAAAVPVFTPSFQPPVTSPGSSSPGSSTPGSTPTTTPPPSQSPGGYANPLRAITGLNPERIDQGVDYSGFGPVYAIGDGVVVNTVGNGWPGGTFVAYRLSNGPAAGLVVFVAEDLSPSVQVGDSVSSGTVLGQMYAGPDGIETGWADGSSLPDTMARSSGQFSGGNSTAFGDNFSRLLQALGAPGGSLQNDPATGSLPGSWPRW